MSSSAVQPTFMDLYSDGRVTADEIDDFIDRWHEMASAADHSIPIFEFLGMSSSDYEAWIVDASILPRLARERVGQASATQDGVYQERS